MTKKKSSKATKPPAKEEQIVAVEPQKPSSTPDKKNKKKNKASSNEIDEIFAGKKRKAPQILDNDRAVDSLEAEQSKSKSPGNKKKKSVKDDEGRFIDPPSTSRKKTEDGFKIYTEEELGINSSNAGESKGKGKDNGQLC